MTNDLLGQLIKNQTGIMRINFYSTKYNEQIEQNYPDLYWKVLLKYSTGVSVREDYEDISFTIKDVDLYSFLSDVYKNIAYRPLIIDNILDGSLSIQIYDDSI